jgi:hypothetical protein
MLEFSIHPDNIKDVPLNRIHDIEEEYEARAKLAQKLGLMKLYCQEHDNLAAYKARLWCEENGLQLLSDEEYRFWSRWLPTVYTSVPVEYVGYGTVRPLIDYAHHEGVPLHVRQLMIKLSDVFSFEIRTPEKMQATDPALFGVLKFDKGRKRVLLARWAESDANHVGFEDIKAIVALRDGRNNGIRTLCADEPTAAVGISMIITVMYILTIAKPLSLNTNIDGIWLMGGAVATMVLTLSPLWLRQLMRLWLKWQYPQVRAHI